MKRALLGKQQKAISYKEFFHSWFSLPAFIQPSCPGENWIFQAPFLLVFHSSNDFLAWTVFENSQNVNANIFTDDFLGHWKMGPYLQILQCENWEVGTVYGP